MLRSRLSLLVLTTLLGFSAVAYAQEKSPADDQYMAAMERMDARMKEATSADPAVSFAKKMMAHHQGGIDMGKAVLEHTNDPTIRKMAQKMIKDQQKEIKDLEAWMNNKRG